MNKVSLPDSGKGAVAVRVAQIAEDLLEELGRLPTGKEVASRYFAEGGNRNTAESYFVQWKRRFLELNAPQDDERSQGPRGTKLGTWLEVSEDGQVTIPQHILSQMRLGEGREVHAAVVDGQLRLSSPSVALDEVRRLVRSFDTGTGSAVDELIAERRAEAARESQE